MILTNKQKAHYISCAYQEGIRIKQQIPLIAIDIIICYSFFF
ncbi:hypothetical protein BvCmsKKP036_03103 [Escherichia coli]|nr:hypothetical protein BvCmsKKP036_03103 [Escherichia coli]